MDEIVVCVTVVGIRVSADKRLINTPFLSNEMIHSTHLRLQYFTAAILCHSCKQSIKFKWEVKCPKRQQFMFYLLSDIVCVILFIILNDWRLIHVLPSSSR